MNRQVWVRAGAALLVVAGMAGMVPAAATNSIVGWGVEVVGDDLCSGFTAVSGGIGHSLGLRASGSILAWGDNESGQCKVPAPNSGFVAVAAGGYHSLGLKADGSIVAWGGNGYGQCNVPAPNSGFVAIAAGEYHSLGLKADGSVVGWGYNRYGQCDPPAPNSGFTAIAAGGHKSLAIRGHTTDITGDGHVDTTDLVEMADSWGKGAGQSSFDARCDLNGNGVVNVVDLLLLADNWGV